MEKNKNISQKIKLRTFYPHVSGSEIGAFLNMILKITMLFYKRKKLMLHAFLPILNNLKLGYLRGKFYDTIWGKIWISKMEISLLFPLIQSLT